jgi:SAM-dependent methyltransferase
MTRVVLLADSGSMEAAHHPHYSRYERDQIGRLDRFYGRVDEYFNERIAEHVVGPRVLDFGCGFGSLVEHLRARGFDATGIDLLDFQVEAGRARFPLADLRVVEDGQPLSFADGEFDTVVFKESLHHVAAEGDLTASLREIRRICEQRLIVFEPNPSVPLKVGRTLIAHVDPTLPPEAAVSVIERAGYDIRSIDYLSSLAFPLSGGYVGRPLLPRGTPTRPLFALDNWVVRAFGSALAWRYLLTADRR